MLTLDPQQEPASRCIYATIPEKYIEPDEGPELPLCSKLFDCAPLEFSRGGVPGSLKPLCCQVDIRLFEEELVRLVWRSGQDEVSQDPEDSRVSSSCTVKATRSKVCVQVIRALPSQLLAKIHPKD